MALYFITGNSNKFSELRAILGDSLEQLDIDLPEIQEIDSHAIIAEKLAEARTQKAGAFIVEDSSLYLDALHGLPGPLIKWFLKTIGNEGLVPIADLFGNTGAEAKTVIGYADVDGNEFFFEGSLRVNIVAPRGTNGFGWDVIFQPEGSDKTFAELSPEEKNAFSMRKLAATKLAAHLHTH